MGRCTATIDAYMHGGILQCQAVATAPGQHPHHHVMPDGVLIEWYDDHSGYGSSPRGRWKPTHLPRQEAS